MDALASRLFLLSLIPRLSTVPSSIRPLEPPASTHRTRALDVGAGIGRVTSSVLIHLCDTIEILEPAPHFLAEAVKASDTWKGLSPASEEKPETARKAARFWEGGLAGFDPRDPGATAKEVARKGLWAGTESEDGKNVLYDVIWCQWCVGHRQQPVSLPCTSNPPHSDLHLAVSTPDLISFLKLAKLSLLPSDPDAVIIVKENLCEDDPKDGVRGSVVFDDDDSSLTRSDKAFKYAFKEAGLTIVREEIQVCPSCPSCPSCPPVLSLSHVHDLTR